MQAVLKAQINKTDRNDSTPTQRTPCRRQCRSYRNPTAQPDVAFIEFSPA
jgi:hypothetical protein